MKKEIKKRKSTAKRFQKDYEEIVLKAWNRGERSFDEIMEITGLPEKTVAKYIPRNTKG